MRFISSDAKTALSNVRIAHTRERPEIVSPSIVDMLRWADARLNAYATIYDVA